MGNAKKQKGFTLIELILVMIIVGIVVAGSSNLLAQGFKSFIATKDIINANRQDIIALESITRDLRMIRSNSDITTASNTSIAFNDTTGNTINYNLNGATIERNSQPLADGLPDLSFAYYDTNGEQTLDPVSICYIVINLGPQKPQTAVYPWNLK